MVKWKFFNLVEGTLLMHGYRLHQNIMDVVEDWASFFIRLCSGWYKNASFFCWMFRMQSADAKDGSLFLDFENKYLGHHTHSSNLHLLSAAGKKTTYIKALKENKCELQWPSTPDSLQFTARLQCFPSVIENTTVTTQWWKQ